MLSEIRPSQKDTYCVIPLIRGPSNNRSHRDGEEHGGGQGRGRGWGVSVPWGQSVGRTRRKASGDGGRGRPRSNVIRVTIIDLYT